MDRPKSSWVGGFDLATDVYTAVKVKNMTGEIDRLQAAQAAGTAMTLSAIGSLAEISIALGMEMVECNTKLETLTKISWKISDYNDHKEMREEFIAMMRYSIHTMNRELDLIDSLTEDTPEYALWKTDLLLEVIEERDVRVEHFARVSEVEMNSAQKFLDRAAATRMKLISLLEGSDGD